MISRGHSLTNKRAKLTFILGMPTSMELSAHLMYIQLGGHIGEQINYIPVKITWKAKVAQVTLLGTTLSTDFTKDISITYGVFTLDTIFQHNRI